MATKPSRERILEELEYRKGDGEFVWLKTKGRKVAGAVAGWIDDLGYRLIRLDGALHRVHHLVIFMEQGYWPKEDVDHIDGNPLNNRIENLRACSHANNQRNMRRHHDSQSQFKGVHWDVSIRKWRGRICVDGKSKYLGVFTDQLSAAKAYDAAASALHGEFARLNGV